MASQYNYLTTNGVIVPDTKDLLADVQEEYIEAFGTDLNLDPESPQGVLMTGEVLARSKVLEDEAGNANQINPNISEGIFLDSICALTGIQRNPGLPSTVSVNLGGVAGTVIPANSILMTNNQDQFKLVSNVTLDGSGEGVGVFQSIELGPIPAAPNTLTIIVTAVLGWETATNPAGATLGQTVQSDQALRSYRKETLAIQGSALSEAIMSGVRAVEGVTSVSFRENKKPTEQVVDGITMNPNSIYVCVTGGTDLDVATAIVTKKSGGSDYTNGASSHPVSQEYTDPYSGQISLVNFDRPDQHIIDVQVTIARNTAITDPLVSITDALIDYANGNIDGEPGLVIGAPVSPSMLSGAITNEVFGVFVLKVEIKKAGTGDPYSQDVINMALWEQALIIQGSVSVIQV